MEFYYQTLYNHWDIDVSKYFNSPPKSPSQLTFLFKPNATINGFSTGIPLNSLIIYVKNLIKRINVKYDNALHKFRMDFKKHMFESHTQWVSVTLAIRLCPSSSLSAWTFLVFRLLLSNCCTHLLQILCGCSLGGPLLSLLKSVCYPYFSWNYG